MRNALQNKQIIIATCKAYPLGNASLQELCKALNAFYQTRLIPWHEIKIPLLPKETLILPLAIWDYSLEIEKFLEFLETLKNYKIAILNTREAILWNLSKEYLLTLKDFPIAPSIVLKQNTYKDSSLKEQIQHLCNTSSKQWENPVIKPLVGQSGIGVKRLNDGVLAKDYPKGLLIQPYLTDITQGEACLICINGVFSHAILRKPTTGEWRANSAYGVSIESLTPPQNYIHLAQNLLESLPFKTLYARIDIIGNASTFYINEIECIEPALYLQEKDIKALIQAILGFSNFS
ncbi:hypothetical protein LS70_002455 [Helicobacter sp. MIT 11-5569]|uniref:ATP-grasp domain-containing protein n=1 Tax=Helicobacter sp. MIT 11-5569 TaxID=1548151 RepID=UPI00051FF3A9|nr:hypothetical protein [Helicobacter sp. MIT 11-5569]TLD84427.1 hypothetical protein LS70_002455 [Helicobacter sp. MIT 11-5569]